MLKRFDVVVFEMGSRKVESIIGENLPLDFGFYNAERRLETALTRINLDSYSAEIVPAGKFKIGDALP